MSSPDTPRYNASISHRPRASKGAHACTMCQQRKIKCDGQRPCAGCVKAGPHVICENPTTVLRRKRRGTSMERDLATRLKHAEALIQRYGCMLNDSDGVEMKQIILTPREEQLCESENGVAGQGSKHGMIICEKDYMRYVESQTWTGLSEEIQESQHVIQGSSVDDSTERVSGPYPDASKLLLSGINPTPSTSANLKSSHPLPIQAFQLWQIFLENVNPLIRLLHGPTTQSLMLEASANLDSISASTEALIFAIYHCAAVSLQNPECERKFGEPRANLMSKFSHATHLALINAKFMKTSDMVVLQALTLYLLSIRQCLDNDTMWILSGTAVRMGQRIGLHRESASSSYPPFVAELRRRLWWHVISLDHRFAQLVGTPTSETFSIYNDSDIKRPLNFNDSDLSPEMQVMPLDHSGVTDMLFCTMRYEISSLMHSAHTWSSTTMTPVKLAEADAQIIAMEKRLQIQYLNRADPMIPLHALSLLMGHTAFAAARLILHHPRGHSSPASIPQSEHDLLFALALQIVRADRELQTNPLLTRFLWHINNVFQLDPFILLLTELRTRKNQREAWAHVESVFDFHPEMLTDTRNAVNVGVGTLALRAWERTGDTGAQIPKWVRLLREQRRRTGQAVEERKEELYIPSDVESADWEYWQSLFEDNGSNWELTSGILAYD
ncbi:MAG: hypothetical protein MMC33_010697 [Icmadophila ericetorum]|nr:hypothetical protein [Icmadophila ericetorum]